MTVLTAPHLQHYLNLRRRGLRPLVALAASLFFVATQRQRRRPLTHREREDIVYIFRVSCDAGLRACIRTAREMISTTKGVTL